MSFSILSLVIHGERDTVAARQRARQIARLLGFDAQDQTRISTAVSEIARNAFNYAGKGRVEYMIEGRVTPQLFIIKGATPVPVFATCAGFWTAATNPARAWGWGSSERAG